MFARVILDSLHRRPNMTASLKSSNNVADPLSKRNWLGWGVTGPNLCGHSSRGSNHVSIVAFLSLEMRFRTCEDLLRSHQTNTSTIRVRRGG